MKSRICTLFALSLLLLPLKASADDWRAIFAQAQQDLSAGNLNEAEEGFRKAETLLEAAKASGPEELKSFGFSLIDCLVGVSKVKDRKGDYAESESVYELALETLKKFCDGGWQNQQYADYLLPLAELYDRHGKIDQADGAYKRLVEIRTTVAPKSDSKIIAAYEAYSKFLRAHSRAGEASPLEAKAAQLKYNNQ